MNILAIDSATEILSVALLSGESVYSDTRDLGLRHSVLLMPLAARVLRDAGVGPADLDLIACTRGPGSFTGLRIGMSTAKGLAAAVAARRGLDSAPLISVSTLDVMAAQVVTGTHTDSPVVLPVIDGRKHRFYAALFVNGNRISGDLDLTADEVLATAREGNPAREIIVTGPHGIQFVAGLAEASSVLVDPQGRRGNARALLQMARQLWEQNGPDAPDVGPVYVRDSDAQLAIKTTRSS